MSLRHALLALLEAMPMTGYDLAKQFDTSVAYVWQASHSQIYPELRRLEAEGFVTATNVPRGTHATKRTYSITVSGCSALGDWVEQSTPAPRERSAAHLKALYLEYASFETARRHYREHLEHHEQQERRWAAHLEALRRRETLLLRRRLSKAGPAAQEAIVEYKTHVYEGLVRRAQDEIAWAREGLDLVERLQSAAKAAPADRPVQPATSDDVSDGPATP